MSTSDMKKAREWAAEIAESRQTNIRPDAFAAARMIQSLPDQWIDADRVREVLDMWAGNPSPTSDEVAVLNDFEALLVPSLPTLAELIEAGNRPEDYQWAWVDTDDGLQVISMAGDFDDEQVYTMDKDGYRSARGWSEIRPRSDLQKWEWPGSAPDDVAYATGGALTTQDVVDECRAVRKERALPRPEDVPAGEPWIVLFGGKRWVGVHADILDRPWSITRMDGLDSQNVADSKIALISRLVPEVKP